jgi:hypothetical protein
MPLISKRSGPIDAPTCFRPSCSLVRRRVRRLVGSARRVRRAARLHDPAHDRVWIASSIRKRR